MSVYGRLGVSEIWVKALKSIRNLFFFNKRILTDGSPCQNHQDCSLPNEPKLILKFDNSFIYSN